MLEAGPRSPWLSRVVADLGHEVVVANPRQVALIARNQRKTDRLDAAVAGAAGAGRPRSCSPRSATGARQSQHDLAVVRGRDALVRSRTLLINHVRGAVKACGAALPSCTAEAFHRKVAGHIPDGLRPALLPLVEAIGELTARIAAAGREVEALCEAHPETAALRQVTGVGPITALTFVLTIEDPGRCPKNREVAAYPGLVPRQRDSGKRQPQLGISRSGDPGLRRLLVQAAHYILGPFGPDTDLRRRGERYAGTGAGNAKKRAIVAVARRLAVLLLALWKTGEVYEPLRYRQTSNRFVQGRLVLNPWEYLPGGVAATSTTITGLMTRVEYTVEVRAVNGNGPGLWSLPDYFTVGPPDEICDIIDQLTP